MSTRTAAGARAEIAERLDALARRLITEHAAELAELAGPVGRGVALLAVGVDGRPMGARFVPVANLGELPRPFRRMARDGAEGARHFEYCVCVLLRAPLLPNGWHFVCTWRRRPDFPPGLAGRAR